MAGQEPQGVGCGPGAQPATQTEPLEHSWRGPAVPLPADSFMSISVNPRYLSRQGGAGMIPQRHPEGIPAGRSLLILRAKGNRRGMMRESRGERVWEDVSFHLVAPANHAFLSPESFPGLVPITSWMSSVQKELGMLLHPLHQIWFWLHPDLHQQHSSSCSQVTHPSIHPLLEELFHQGWWRVWRGQVPGSPHRCFAGHHGGGKPFLFPQEESSEL